jgi:NADH dehydrogenase
MILIVGSTGSLGTAVTKKLAAAGRKVTALVRDPSSDKAGALKAAGAKLATGDLKDPASLERALEGVDTVICTASSTMSRREGDSLETVDGKGVQSLIDAAERKGVRRFIFVSFSRNIEGDFPLAKFKRAAEKRLESSKLDYTILLPSYFSETWLSPVVGFDVAGGTVRIYGDGKAKGSYVALEDVAKAVVACVDNPKASRQAIPVGGSKPYSQLEAADLVERATGQKLEREHMTAEQIKAARAGATDPMQATFLGLFDGIAHGDVVPSDWTRTLGVQPGSLEDWVQRTFGARRA